MGLSLHIRGIYDTFGDKSDAHEQKRSTQVQLAARHQFIRQCGYATVQFMFMFIGVNSMMVPQRQLEAGIIVDIINGILFFFSEITLMGLSIVDRTSRNSMLATIAARKAAALKGGGGNVAAVAETAEHSSAVDNNVANGLRKVGDLHIEAGDTLRTLAGELEE